MRIRSPGVAAAVLLATAMIGLSPAAGAAAAECQGVRATIVGTDGHDDLVGTSGHDVIQAGAGRDDVQAMGGRDLVCGGSGQDTLNGGAGRDAVYGGDDSRYDQGDGAYFIGDDLTGGPGDDLLVGGDGRGQDSIRFDHAARGVHVDLDEGTATGAGKDTFDGVERVWGSRHADRMVGRRSSLEPHVRDDLGFWGQGGADWLRSDGELQAGPGDDTVLPAGGGWVEAGGGHDRLTYSPWKVDPGRTEVYASAGPGDDSIDFSQATRSGVGPGSGNDVVVGGDGNDFVSLSEGDDTVTTGDGNDGVSAGYGADVVRTGPGDDSVITFCGTTDLDAGPGDDLVDAGGFYTTDCTGPGDDLLAGGAGRDTLSYKGLRLYRTVDGVQVDLAAGTVTGYAGNDTVSSFRDVIGSGGKDLLTGNDGDNMLAGFTGVDEVHGAGGDDQLSATVAPTSSTETTAKTPPTAARAPTPARRRPSRPARRDYSHSMVPGGLLVTSIVTRLTARTSLVIRVEIASTTSYGSRAQSAVIASSEVTGRSTTGCP